MSQRLGMLEQMIAKGALDPFVHYARAMELRTLGRTADALNAFSAVRDRFPSYVPTYLMAGQLALELDDAATARAFLQQGLERAREAGDDHAQAELAKLLGTLTTAD